jgi:dTDP-glucose pyrophosphorylase
VNILVPMAGDSQRFQEAGYSFPKNLVEISGFTLVEIVLRQLAPLTDRGRIVCLIRDDENRRFHTADVIKLICPSATVLTVAGLESGAACTALLAIEHLVRDEPLLVFNGDQHIGRDIGEIVRQFEERDLDGGTVVFHAVHPRWSYVRLDGDGLVVEAAEKRPISTHATAGAYWYRRAGDFIDAIMDMIRKDARVDDRYFICPAFNEMILRQKRIGVVEIDRGDYHSFATPQGVRDYDDALNANRPAARL